MSGKSQTSHAKKSLGVHNASRQTKNSQNPTPGLGLPHTSAAGALSDIGNLRMQSFARGKGEPGSVGSGNIRVFEGGQVESSLEALGAPGAAVGRDVFISKSLPPTIRRAVLAHEVTHARQAGNREAKLIREVGRDGGPEEREANIAAAIGVPLIPRHVNADPNVIRLFNRDQLLHGSINQAWASDLNDQELVQASNALNAQMALMLTSSPDYDAAVANRKTLDDELQRRDMVNWHRDEAARAIARRPEGPPVAFGIDDKTGTVYVSVTATGATLQEIATYLYGTPEFATKIAEANGMLATIRPAAGTSLKLPEGRQSQIAQDALLAGRKSGVIMRTEGIPDKVSDNGMVYAFPGPSGLLQLNSGQFNAVLAGIRRRTLGQLQIYTDSIAFLRKLRVDHEEENWSIIRGVSDWAGDVELPSVIGYDIPLARGKAVLASLEGLEFQPDPRVTAQKLHALQLQAISVIEDEARLEANWQHYIAGTISGAEITVNRLEIVRNISFGMLAGMAGALAAPAAFAALGGSGAWATVGAIGVAGTTGGVVRGTLEVALPGAQADKSAGERFASGYWSGYVAGATGGAGSFVTPAVSGAVTSQFATRFGQGFAQSTTGQLAAQSTTGLIIGAPSGVVATGVETLPGYVRGDLSGEQYGSGIFWGGVYGGAFGAASPAIPIKGLYRSGGTPVTPKWMLAGPYSPLAELRGATAGFHNLPEGSLPAFADDPAVAGYAWARVRSGGVDQWVPVRTYGPSQQFELAWYADPNNPSAAANFNLLYGRAGNPNALGLVGSRAIQRPQGAGYAGMQANDPFPGAPRSTRTDFPMTANEFEVTLPDGTTRRMIRGHNVDFFDTTDRTVQIPDSNLDVRNFTPEPREWGTLSGRNRLTMRMRTAGAGGGTEYRQINVYGRNPAMTASGKPVPEHIYFIEIGPNGTASRAWRIPFDDPNAFQGINMNRAADIDAAFGINPASLPKAVEIVPTNLPAGVLSAALTPLAEQK